MPTVPTTFVPQVAPQVGGDIGQFQAPQVATAENLAAQQEVRFGQAMTQAGNVAFRIGSAIQDDIDDANAKAADTWMLTNATQLLRGENGYLRSVGKNAVDGFQPTQEALAALGQQALDRATNDTQRRMLQPVIARNMMTLQTQLFDHYEREAKGYATGEAKARSQMRAQLAIEDFKNRDVPTSEYQVNAGLALQEIEKAGELAGFAPDSAQMSALKRGVTTEITQGVVNRLMLDNDYDAAYQFTKSRIKDGMVDRDTGDRLMAAIDANRDRWMIDQYAVTIKTYGRVGMPDDEKNNPDKAPESLRDALAIAADIPDPEIRGGVQAALRAQYGQEESMRKAEYASMLDNVENILAMPNATVANIPPAQWAALTPKDQKRLLKGVAQEDELDVMEEITRNPGLLTEEWLDKNRSRMTRETFNRLLKESKDPAKMFEATVDAQQLNATLVDNGFYDIANPGSESDRTKSYLLRNNIESMIDAEQQRLGKKLSRQEKQRIIDQAIIEDRAVRTQGINTNMPVAMMTQEEFRAAYVDVGGEEIPALYYRAGRQALIAAGATNPTPQQIAAWYDAKRRKGQLGD